MKVFRIGLSVYVMPSDPVVGDMKALREWKPTKMNFWKGLYMIYKYKELR